MNINLLALDLDGTLLDRNGRLLPENREAVAAARAAGLEVVLVTGRSWRSTRPIYQELGLTGPAICYLGALVVADATGRIAHHRPLAQAAWERLRTFALGGGLSLTACVGTDQAVAEGDLPSQNLLAADRAFATCRAADFTAWEDWNPYSELDPDLAQCQSAPIMAAIYGDRAVQAALQAFPDGLPDSQFDLTDRIAGEMVLHVWHCTVDKGVALAQFCHERGIHPDQVAAMGDAPMDISMIRFAGLGVAVPGGDAETQAAADLVATPAEAIARILRGDLP